MGIESSHKSAFGKCNCGTISFEVRGPLSDIYVCHCSICRTYSGAGSFPVVVIPNEQFHWASGQENIQRWKKPGHDWEAHFCKTCGSPVPGPNDETRTFVPAGLIFEGGEALKVAHHIFVGSKASWEDIAGTGLQHHERLS